MPELSFRPVDRRILCLCIVFVLQVVAVRAVNLREEIASSPQLSEIPQMLGPWQKIREAGMDSEVMDLLHPDEYVSRLYEDKNGSPPIDLFAAYFRSLKTRYGPHSPKVCLPGSGWKEVEAHVSQVQLAGGMGSIPVNDYVLEKGKERIVVMYWYQNKRHTWAEEFVAKFYLLPDLIAHHRSDVAIIRLVTTVDPHGVAPALEASRQFVRQLYPVLQARFAKT